MNATVTVGAAPGQRADGVGEPAAELRTIPEATVARLASYLHVLSGHDGATTVSSEELAALAGVNPAKLRKDLSYLGSHGTRGVGYDVPTLLRALQRTLGAHEVYPVAMVGIGHLGSALAGYGGFAGRGFAIRVLLDSDPAKIGTRVAGIEVSDVADAVARCRAAGAVIGVIATPEAAAQQVADMLVVAGIRSILTFAPAQLSLPDDVEVRRVDLATELQMLAFHESHRGRSLGRVEAV